MRNGKTILEEKMSKEGGDHEFGKGGRSFASTERVALWTAIRDGSGGRFRGQGGGWRKRLGEQGKRHKIETRTAMAQELERSVREGRGESRTGGLQYLRRRFRSLQPPNLGGLNRSHRKRRRGRGSHLVVYHVGGSTA